MRSPARSAGASPRLRVSYGERSRLGFYFTRTFGLDRKTRPQFLVRVFGVEGW